MRRHFLTAVRITFVLMILVSVLYPLVVWGIGQMAFRHKANGSLLVRDGKVIGTEIIGQPFSADRYFHPRPSAAGSGYDAASSGGSNLGPTSQKLADRIRESVSAMRARGVRGPIPADAVTASASGLDPHISPENARLQASRVARARGLAEQQVLDLVAGRTENRLLGVYGEPRVNVLLLNLDLDRRQ